MDIPESIFAFGEEYVRRGAFPMIERSYSITELSELSGFPVSTLYDNVRRGDLKAVMPNGTTKGMRVLGSEWLRFLEAKTA